MAAVSLLSRLCSSLLASKSQTAPNLSPPSQLHLRGTLTGPNSLVATFDPSPIASESSPLSSSGSDISSVLYPALAYASIHYFKTAYNVQVIVGENEPEEKLLSRFRKEVLKAGVLQECKRRRFFENRREKKKRKAREAARRNRKRRSPPKPQVNPKYQTPKERNSKDDDNWDLPEVEVPYC